MTRVTGARRTALLSIVAALVLVVLKLVVGLLAHSLALVADAVHSGTDLVAALLTFLSVGVAGRPADREHPFGHGKAEHLSALGEGGILIVASLAIAYESAVRLSTGRHPADAHLYVLLTVVAAILVDLTRTVASRRAAVAHNSAALHANAIHFALDLTGSIAVLIGLLIVRGGHASADSIAALIVAGLVLVSAGRIMRRNVAVLMDRAPGGAETAARRAIASLAPPVSLRRLRMREAGGRHFADVVVGVPPDAGLPQGHAVASAIEAAIDRELPGSDVVVHVEPAEPSRRSVRQAATAAALTVPEVREIHNVTALRVGEDVELALHLKVSPALSLADAHAIADRVEQAIREAVPRVRAVQTHIEPLREEIAARSPDPAHLDERAVARLVALVREVAGTEPAEVRFRETDDGFVAFVTLRLAAGTPLPTAHRTASLVEQRLHDADPRIADVVVHTEPGAAPGTATKS